MAFETTTANLNQLLTEIKKNTQTEFNLNDFKKKLMKLINNQNFQQILHFFSITHANDKQFSNKEEASIPAQHFASWIGSP